MPYRPDGSPVIVRPGEHACCRFGSAADRRRVVLSVVGNALREGERAVYLHDHADAQALVSALAAADGSVGPALERGQLRVCSPRTYAPDGMFDIEFLFGWCSDECDRAVADGYESMTLVVEIGAAFAGALEAETIANYEQRLDALAPLPVAILCVYDPASVTASSVAAGSHDVDLAPELAPVGRECPVEAAHLRSGALRLTGELDFDAAPVLTDVLSAGYPQPLALDLAGLRYVDVAGMRALRGRPSERQIAVVAASEPVRRLIGLIGWDTDPDVAVVTAGPAYWDSHQAGPSEALDHVDQRGARIENPDARAPSRRATAWLPARPV
jgi:anti-anti-sigma regulatory factor